MRRPYLALITKEKMKHQCLRNKTGDVLFIGTLRQIKRRLKVIFGSGTAIWMNKQLASNGWEITEPPTAVLKADGTVYNKGMDHLKEKLKEIPKTPGVYEFLNHAGEVIYVGKAKNLKNRVGQYLSGHDDRPQLPYLMAEAADVRYTVTSSELESLYLENTLIKKFLPKYNIMLRDDKNYAFITIDYSCQIPQIGYARKFEPETSKTKDKGSKIRYFGPYSAVWKIRNTLGLARRIFPYCSNTQVSNRPCFYYFLHRCPGVCVGKITLDEYRQQLDRICAFLAGNTSKIKKELREEMKQAAASQQFEKAARLRDQCRALELLEERQNAIMNKPVSWDVISLATDSGYACVNLFKIREGKMMGKENFVYELSDRKITSPNPSSEEEGDETHSSPFSKEMLDEVIQQFLEQYYLETSDAPKTIFAQVVEDAELIDHIIRNRFDRKTEITVPQKGKAADLIKLGITNAEEYIKHWLTSQAGHLDKIQSALQGLKDSLNLEKIPERIECYDISNTQGTNPVGSMVVFKNGLPAKSEYRKFKIQSKKTPDDFTMMKEMLTRRFARIESKFQDTKNKNQISSNPDVQNDSENLKSETLNPKPHWPTPDLIVIDGGKGQLSAALEVLQKFQISHSQIPIIGLAKRIEEIFFPENPIPLVLPHDNPSLQLLQRLRDEAHRFGITFHRQLRSKQAVKSALDSIPGIGPKTKKLLKQKFGTVAQIRTTPFEELKNAVGQHIAELLQKGL